MKPSNRLEHLMLDRIGQLFGQALVACDLRQNHIDTADPKAASDFLVDERRHHPAAIAAALATASRK